MNIYINFVFALTFICKLAKRVLSIKKKLFYRYSSLFHKFPKNSMLQYFSPMSYIVFFSG